MNSQFIVATIAMLLLLRVNAVSAGPSGPYDGEWQGTATSSTGERCKRGAVVNFTVEGRVVLGQAKFDGDVSSISGSVTENGAVGATIGFQFLKGQFNGDEFEGTFKLADCQWEAVLRRPNGGDRNHAASSASRGR